jgi:hypothetical protein
MGFITSQQHQTGDHGFNTKAFGDTPEPNYSIVLNITPSFQGQEILPVWQDLPLLSLALPLSVH